LSFQTEFVLIMCCVYFVGWRWGC